jgi:hypothetical protein
MKSNPVAVSVFALCTAALSGSWPGAVHAALYQVTVESPSVVFEPMEAYPLAPLELGTKVSSLNQVRVQVSGIHSNGWWVGDGIEDDYIGPRGASLTVYVFVGATVEIPGLIPNGWYEGRIECTNDGAFTSDLTLRPAPRTLVSVPYVPDGRVALCCVTWGLVGHGHMAQQPYLDAGRVEIDLEVEPTVEITSFGVDGILSWSALPAGGIVEILSAPEPCGPWEPGVRLPSESGFTEVHPPHSGGRRFLRLRWQESVSP